MQAGAQTTALACQFLGTPEGAPAGSHQQKAEGCSQAQIGARSVHSSASTQPKITSLQTLSGTELLQKLFVNSQPVQGKCHSLGQGSFLRQEAAMPTARGHCQRASQQAQGSKNAVS